MVQAIATLVQARLRIARNTFWRGKRGNQFGIVLLALALAGAGFGLYQLMRLIVELLTSPRFMRALQEAQQQDPTLQIPASFQPYLDAVPGQALFFLFVLLLLTSFSAILSALYLSGDMDMLLVAPVPMRAVFAVKFAGALLLPYALLFTLLAPALVGYGQALGFSAAYYVALLVVLALFPLLPAGIAAGLVMLIVRVIPARRARDIVGVIGGMIGIFWFIVSQFARDIFPQVASINTLENLRTLSIPVLPSAWAGQALLAAGTGEWTALTVFGGLFVVVTLAVFGGCLVLAERLYYAGWANLANQGGRVRARTETRRNQRSIANVLGAVLPAPARAVFAKDLRVFPRDLRNIQQFIFPLVLSVIWTVQLLTRPEQPQDTISSGLTSLASLGIAFYICLTLSGAIAGNGVSREGKGYWQLKLAPIQSRDILLGKLAIAYLPYPTIGIIFVLLLSVLQGSSAPLIVRDLLVVLLAGLGTTAISLASNALFPRLSWEKPNQQVTFRGGLLSMVGLVLYTGLVFGLVFGLPLLGQAFPAWGLLATAGAWVAFVGITALVVWLTLTTAAARLDRLEVA